MSIKPSPHKHDQSTEIHSLCYSRVTLLTNEVEKLSDVLLETSKELEILRTQKEDILTSKNELEQSNLVLNQEFDQVCDRLKQKTIENEDYAFRLQKLQLVNQDLKTQINRLVTELERMTELISLREQDLSTSKSQFIAKTEELSQAFQQIYHLENGLKQIKDEKLKYIHEYSNLEKEKDQLLQEIEDLKHYKQDNEQLRIDIDTIRQNYGFLVEQRQQEKINFEASLDVLRQMSDFSLEDAYQKYQELIEQEVMKVQKSLDQEHKVQILTYEQEISTLKNQLGTLNLEVKNAELQIETYKQNIQLYIQQEVSVKDQRINELQIENEKLRKLYTTNNQELEEWRIQIQQGKVMRYDDDFKKQIEQFYGISKLKQELEIENQQLRKELRLIKENYTLLTQNQNQSLLLSSIAPTAQSTINVGKISDAEKIKYLLKAVDQLQNAITQRDNEILKLSQVSQQPVKQSAVFYHVNSTEFSQFVK